MISFVFMKGLSKKFLLPLVLTGSLLFSPIHAFSRESQKKNQPNFYMGASIGPYIGTSKPMLKEYGFTWKFRGSLGLDLSKNFRLEGGYTFLNKEGSSTIVSGGLEGMAYYTFPFNEHIKFHTGGGLTLTGLKESSFGDDKTNREISFGPVFAVGLDMLSKQEKASVFFDIAYRYLGPDKFDGGGFSLDTGVRLGF